jgi:predicted ATPase
MLDVLADVKHGAPGKAVLLSGESGAGKTVLAEWLVAQAHESGFSCARATCEPFHAGMSFFPISELSRRLAGPASTVQELVEGGYGRNSNEANAAARAFDDTTDPAVKREYVMATFANAVVAKAAISKQPLVLFLDDAERIDSASVDALIVLLSRLDEARVLLLAAFREDVVAADKEHPLRSAIDRARRGAGNVQLIEVHPLPSSEFAALVGSFLDGAQDLPELFLRRLLRETEGNPLHVREVIRALRSPQADSGPRISKRDDGTWDFGASSDLWDVPQSIEDAIASRLAPVTDRQRSILEAAAVIGRQFQFKTLAAVTGMNEQDLLEDLDELVSLDLLSESQDSDSISFTHGKVGEVVKGQLTGLRRTRLHAQVADVLDQQRDLYPPGEWESAMGEHLLKARKYDAASPYLIQAGERLLSGQAGQEASVFFRNAVEALEKSNAPDPKKLAEVRLKLGESLKLASQLDAALRELELVSASADSEMARRWALDHIGDIFKMRDRIDEALDYYGRCESLAFAANDRELVAELAADLAELHMREAERLAGLDAQAASQHEAEYKRYLDIETEYVDDSSSKEARSRSLRNRAKYARAHDDPKAAISLYEESLALQDRGVASHQFIIPYAKALRLVGRADDALTQVELVLDWSRQIGALRSEAIARQYRGLLLMERALGDSQEDQRSKDLVEARRELEKALLLHEETGFRQGFRETSVDLFELEVEEGHWDAAIVRLHSGAIFPGISADKALVRAVLAQLEANGESDRSHRILDRLTALGWTDPPENPA